MKLHFEPDLDFQKQAIEAVCDLFHGQEVCRSEFTVTLDRSDLQGRMAFAQYDVGIGNRLKLLDDELLHNLQSVQLRNGLRPSDALASKDFTVEMETGTGKTYVYLRTVFELNRRYGFTKFVVVVPSVAIKEGVNKSLQMMEDHFRTLYANVPFEYFPYDSSKLGQVRTFATSPNIQIMVVTVGAINKKDVNNLYKDSEKTGGDRPIDLIRETHPIVIVDEPQSVDGGLEGRGREALSAMAPLCTLRYSATHANKYNMVYRLDAVDAYDRKLVKQIEVAEARVESAHNHPYVKLLSTSNKRNVITADVEVDVQGDKKVERTTMTVQDGDMLDQITGRRIYENCRIGEIRVGRDNEIMEVRVPGSEQWLRPGQAIGGVNHEDFQRLMIRRTIQEHLEKEKRLAPLGIKVLSLFFIDTVENYRRYDAEGNAVKGKLALQFEEEYRRLASSPDFSSLFKDVDVRSLAEDVHDGYFSIDKKGRWTNTSENNQGNRDSAERAYNLIMRDKERLLSFDTKLKFIFSHSALKEGWDNPNVFQICALRDIGTERERRQTIGRGLRLCVNQDGERLRGFDINTLTVVATESYEQFAENLQKEIEADTGIRFGIVEQHQFAAMAMAGQDGKPVSFGFEQSVALWNELRAQGYIDGKGKVQDKLRTTLKDGTLQVPEAFAAQLPQIKEVLRKLSGKLDIKNAADRKTISPRRAILQSEEFKALWDRIKQKTTYRVEFDNDALLKSCIASMTDLPPIPKSRLVWHKADLSIGKSGVEATERSVSSPIAIEEGDIELPDILTELQNRTQLTRRSLVTILTGSGRLADFRRNPQYFIEQAAETILRAKRLAIVNGIKYQRIGDECYYAQELFETEELTGYLNKMLAVTKATHEFVVYDSDVESNFADQLEKNSAVKVYAKLPGWFKVPTPLGNYNPDWAVLVKPDGEAERLYFVVETKKSLFTEDLRNKEEAKMKCGKAHFKELAKGKTSPARFIKATKIDDLAAHF